MQLIVSQAHIDNGDRGTCGRCPVALALLDAGYTQAFVGDLNVSGLAPTGRPVRAKTPANVAEFISAFDRRGPIGVRPSTFEINFYPTGI